MKRFPLFFCLFALCASAWSKPFFNLERVRGDAEGRTYVVFTVSEALARTRGEFFFVVLRFLPSGELDSGFGPQGKGVMALKDLEGWNQVGFKDLRFGDDGSFYLMGEVSMKDFDLANPRRMTQLRVFDNLLNPDFDSGKEVTRKVFVSKFHSDGTPAAFGHDGSALVHGILEHSDDEAVGLAVDRNGKLAITARVHRDLRKDEGLVAMLDADGEVKQDFGQKGLYRIPRHFTPRPRSFEDDFLSVREPWFDGDKVRLVVNRSTFGRRSPKRGDAEVNYLIDLPVSGHATRIQVERLLSIGRIMPLHEDQDSFRTARAVSNDGDSLYMVIWPPTTTAVNLRVLRYSMASGERRVGIGPGSQPEIGRVFFRGMQAGPDQGLEIFVQPHKSGAMRRLHFNEHLELQDILVIPEVTSAQMDYRDCSQRIRDLVGDPFAK